MASGGGADWREVSQEIMRMVFENAGFCSASVVFKDHDRVKVSVRPIIVRGTCLWQFVRGGQSCNLCLKDARAEMLSVLNSDVSETHVMTSDGDLHCRIAKRGTVLVSRGRSQTGRSVSKGHDHVKDYPLERHDFSKLLRVLGFADGVSVKPSMYSKYRQVNEFLRILDTAIDDAPSVLKNNVFSIVDVGCGKSYLSFAAKAYIEKTRGVTVSLTGVDIKEQVVDTCVKTAELMEWENTVKFVQSDIAKFRPNRKVDLVVSLHACDTATDEAIAFGIELGAKLIVCVPCCQHELQKKLGGNLCRAVMRNGILRERMADILADAFRAEILRVAGYRTSVMEFVDQEATARNVLIRSVKTSRRGPEAVLTEYQELCEEWHCIPYLAERLSETMPCLAACKEDNGQERSQK